MTSQQGQRFCSQCGVALQPPAAFCVACGAATGSASPAAGRKGAAGDRLRPYAPALIIGTLMAVAGLAIGLGYLRQPPPRQPLPRGGTAPAVTGAPSTAGSRLPSDHPPIEIPETVRSAIARMEEVAAAQPDNLPAWKELAFVHYRTGQVDPSFLAKAEASYRHILEREANDLDALRGLGNVAYDRNDPERAMEYYQRFLAIDPADKSVRTDLGTMLLTAQRPAEAIRTYQSVLQEDPTYFQAQFNLAIAYRAAGEDDLALASLHRAREIAGDDQERARVESILGASDAGAPAAGAPGAPQGSLRDAVEAVFRAHPIVGPRIDSIHWESDQKATVTLREFPMAGMPPMVREKFVERLTSGLADSKRRHASTEPIAVDLVDASSGTTMLTVSN